MEVTESGVNEHTEQLTQMESGGGGGRKRLRSSDLGESDEEEDIYNTNLRAFSSAVDKLQEEQDEFHRKQLKNFQALRAKIINMWEVRVAQKGKKVFRARKEMEKRLREKELCGNENFYGEKLYKNDMDEIGGAHTVEVCEYGEETGNMRRGAGGGKSGTDGFAENEEAGSREQETGLATMGDTSTVISKIRFNRMIPSARSTELEISLSTAEKADLERIPATTLHLNSTQLSISKNATSTSNSSEAEIEQTKKTLVSSLGEDPHPHNRQPLASPISDVEAPKIITSTTSLKRYDTSAESHTAALRTPVRQSASSFSRKSGQEVPQSPKTPCRPEIVSRRRVTSDGTGSLRSLPRKNYEEPIPEIPLRTPGKQERQKKVKGREGTEYNPDNGKEKVQQGERSAKKVKRDPRQQQIHKYFPRTPSRNRCLSESSRTQPNIKIKQEQGMEDIPDRRGEIDFEAPGYTPPPGFTVNRNSPSHTPSRFTSMETVPEKLQLNHSQQTQTSTSTRSPPPSDNSSAIGIPDPPLYFTRGDIMSVLGGKMHKINEFPNTPSTARKTVQRYKGHPYYCINPDFNPFYPRKVGENGMVLVYEANSGRVWERERLWAVFCRRVPGDRWRVSRGDGDSEEEYEYIGHYEVTDGGELGVGEWSELEDGIRSIWLEHLVKLNKSPPRSGKSIFVAKGLAVEGQNVKITDARKWFNALDNEVIKARLEKRRLEFKEYRLGLYEELEKERNYTVN